jgi:hypothetical protein
MRICLAIGLLSLFVSPARAQDNPDLNQLDEKVSRYLESKMVGWTHKRGEPIQGSRNVLVEFWSFSNRVVKISILPQKSAQAVREKIQSFVRITPELATGHRGTHDYNSGFVFACYRGFLRRNPNAPPDNNWEGFNFWVNKLDSTNPDASDGKYNEMLKAFVESSEYRQRFGPP